MVTPYGCDFVSVTSNLRDSLEPQSSPLLTLISLSAFAKDQVGPLPAKSVLLYIFDF